MPVSTGTTPSGTGFSGYVGPNVPPGLLKRDSHPDDDNKVIRCPTKTTPGSGRILCDTRIKGSYSRATRRCHCGKVVRKTPPCICERGRRNLDVLESAERVSQDHFDATVSHDRVHLRTIAVPLRPGIAPSKLSRLLGGSVL